MYDVIIVGAGPAGATSALYAERNNLRCIVLDKAILLFRLGGVLPDGVADHSSSSHEN